MMLYDASAKITMFDPALQKSILERFVESMRETPCRKAALRMVRQEFRLKLRMRKCPISRSTIYLWAKRFQITIPR